MKLPLAHLVVEVSGETFAIFAQDGACPPPLFSGGLMPEMADQLRRIAEQIDVISDREEDDAATI